MTCVFVVIPYCQLTLRKALLQLEKLLLYQKGVILLSSKEKLFPSFELTGLISIMFNSLFEKRSGQLPIPLAGVKLLILKPLITRSFVLLWLHLIR